MSPSLSSSHDSASFFIAPSGLCAVVTAAALWRGTCISIWSNGYRSAWSTSTSVAFASSSSDTRQAPLSVASTFLVDILRAFIVRAVTGLASILLRINQMQSSGSRTASTALQPHVPFSYMAMRSEQRREHVRARAASWLATSTQPPVLLTPRFASWARGVLPHRMLVLHGAVWSLSPMRWPKRSITRAMSSSGPVTWSGSGLPPCEGLIRSPQRSQWYSPRSAKRTVRAKHTLPRSSTWRPRTRFLISHATASASSQTLVLCDAH